MEAMSEEEIGGSKKKACAGACGSAAEEGASTSSTQKDARKKPDKTEQSPVWSRAEKSYPPARMKMGKYGSSHKGNRYVRHASQQL